ncbi:MAG: glutathione-regulated potassium-efflux system ancillary protein KefG [Gammaproteobacteria bacterium]|jgi:glutathione-regulated potassium-efflux system ancillary protein KefG
MRRVLILYAHPGQRHSQVNTLLSQTAATLEGITFVDLYADYPRFKVNIDIEQQRLLAHDVIVLQFPVYWYSTPSLLKEWQDLVLEYGFAYGPGGDKLAGKLCLLAVTAGGPPQAYCEDGSNQFRLRTLLSPLEQTAKLCQMHFLPPFALFSSLDAHANGRGEAHAKGYRELLIALRDDTLDIVSAQLIDLLSHNNLPLRATV